MGAVGAGAGGGTKLRKFLLRYYPPGIVLQYERDGVMKQKPVDLLDLSPDMDVEVCVCVGQRYKLYNNTMDAAAQYPPAHTAL
jgi:hypothetical protein